MGVFTNRRHLNVIYNSRYSEDPDNYRSDCREGGGDARCPAVQAMKGNSWNPIDSTILRSHKKWQ